MYLNYFDWRQPTPLEAKYLALKLIDIFPEDLKPNEGWAHQFYQKIYYEYIDVNGMAQEKLPSVKEKKDFFETVFHQVNKDPPPKLQGVSLKAQQKADEAYLAPRHGAMIFRADQDKVLLVHEKQGDRWGIPKGKMQYYEYKLKKIEDTVEREVFQQVNLEVSVKNCRSVRFPCNNMCSKVYVLYIDSPQEKINYCRKQLRNAKWFDRACFKKKWQGQRREKCHCMKGVRLNWFTKQAAKKIQSLSDSQQDSEQSQEIINNRNQFTAEEESVLKNPSWAEKSAKVEQHETLKQNQE